MSVSCNADGSASITYTYGDVDQASGYTQAYTRLTTGTPGSSSYYGDTLNASGWTFHSLSASGTDTLSADNTFGTYNVWLYVRDIGGTSANGGIFYGGTGYAGRYAQKVKCNHPVRYHIDTWTCHSLTGWAYDPDASSQSLTTYFDVYKDDGTTLIEHRGGGNSQANVPRPDVDSYYGITGNHGIDLDPLNNLSRDFGGWQSIKIQIYAADANTGAKTPLGGQVTIRPCVAASCTTDFAGTVAIGTKETFYVAMTASEVNNPSGGVTAYGFTPGPSGATVGVKVTDPSGAGVSLQRSGTAFDPTKSVPYTYPTASWNGLNFMVTKVGTYAMNASLTVPNNTGGNTVKFTGCGGASGSTLVAGYQPYFDVLGGDVAAGPGFGSSCTEGADAGITGALNAASSSPSGYYGSGTQLAALALGNITQFATALNDDGSNSGNKAPPSGLAFANSTAGGAIYGGGYAKPTWCEPDYASKALADAKGSLDFTTSGTYHLTGNQTIGNITLGKGKRVTIVVTGGNVFIDGTIKYNTSYAKAADIPQFQLIVVGNIYIENTVPELHGFYAAQPRADGTGGKLFTCATALNVPVKGDDPANDFGTCNHRLTVYGAVAASQLILGRTYGNVTGSGAPATPAEQFIYDPELWLGDLVGPTDSSEPYQAFTSLPPIL